MTDGSNDSLRQRAEELLKGGPEELKHIDPEKINDVLHELQVHRIELELQNEELRESQRMCEAMHLRFARLYNNAPVGYVVLDKAGIVAQTNRTFARMINRDFTSLSGSPFASFLTEESERVFRARYKAFFRNPANKFVEVSFGTDDKRRFVGHLEAVPHRRDPIQGEDQGYDELLVTVSDITERKEAENRIDHLNQVLRAIRNVNQLIVKEKDRGRLIESTCRNLSETRGYFHAWIVLFDHEGATAQTAQSGLDCGFEQVQDLLRRGKMPLCGKKALDREDTVVTRMTTRECGDCPLAGEYGDRAAMTIQLRHEGTSYGLLVVSIPADMADEEEEIALFEELAGDISFALHDIENEEQRIRAQEALRESEAMLSKSQQIAHVGSWVLDLRTGALLWSDEVYRIFGLRPGQREATYEGFLERVHPDDREAVDAAYAGSIEEGRDSYEIDHRIVSATTGEIRFVHEKCEHVRDTTGRIVRSVGMVQDITEQKKGQEKLRAERERLAVTLTSIGDGVITTDTRGRVVLINHVAEALTGWTQQDARGQDLADVFHIVNEYTRKPCINPVQRVLETGEIIELSNHTMLIGRDGCERIIADSGAPILDSAGEIIGVVLVFRDVTEKQRLLDHLQQTEKLDSLGVLAGGLAHDFNNLLGGIFGYLDLARTCSTQDELTAKYIDKALAAFNRAKDLTQQLLTFAKGGVPVRKTGDIASRVRESASFVLSGSNVACRFEIPEGIWACDYDENQIGQVIDNLVINAQQSMPMGGTITVGLENVHLEDDEVGALREGNYVRLRVSDHGVGIPAEIVGKIFDPFFTTKQKGSGLGLATCYSILQKHDGHIHVESTPGQGSTFYLHIPASKSDVSHRTAAETVALSGSGSIIVMDDEAFIREIAGEMLRHAGFEVIEAGDGREALEACRTALAEGVTVSAAIFDLTVPGGLGGKQAAVEMRHRYPEIPVFASSGYSSDPVMARPREFGFVASIRKPYRKSELYEVLAHHLPDS
jgi:PAS domain S-box-containing protein